MIAVAGIDSDMPRPPHQVTGFGFRSGHVWARVDLIFGVSREINSKLSEYMLGEAGAVIADWTVATPYVREPDVLTGKLDSLLALGFTPSEVRDGWYLLDATLKFGLLGVGNDRFFRTF